MALRRSCRIPSKNVVVTQSSLDSSSDSLHKIHEFTPAETTSFQNKLLQWYDKNKRDLPWRDTATEDDNVRAYAVLVSEIMLQQTQVITVKQYYEKWMYRWPTFQDLAKATLEEVNEMWSGLGYYSRGRRLYETAKKIVNEMSGQVPTTAAKLQEQLPGVGRYTAGAVASIAFKQRVGAVDGNVIRVLARMRLIGSDSSSQSVVKQIWNIAETNVDSNRPGDFNQAMMELGAVVCTPRTPNCGSCPVSELCSAYKLSTSDIGDIESLPGCLLCLPESETWNISAGVTNFPRKAKKAAPRKQETAVAVMHRRRDQQNEYLLMKRSAHGLLANLWEFPSFILAEKVEDIWGVLIKELNKHLEISDSEIESQEHVSNIKHIFSHIHEQYIVYAVKVSQDKTLTTPEHYQEQRWVSEEQFLSSAVSTGMKKIFKHFRNRKSDVCKGGKRQRSGSNSSNQMKKERSVCDFFAKIPKNSNNA